MFFVSLPVWAGVGNTVSKLAEYIGRSRAFAAAAEVASDPARKVRFLEMAQHWAHLAEVAERNDLLQGRLLHDPASSRDHGGDRAH